jgi:DNA polymerase-3 subunit gamma/tau
LIEIDAASNTSVEDVRDLRDKINFAPNEGRFKVYIVDEVHMLSTAAFNALLKTLEEPPAHAIFILATTEVHKIPATVLSRCQRHEFRRLPVSILMDHLQRLTGQEQIEIEFPAIELIARQATGSVRDAISLLDQLSSTGEVVSLKLAQEVLGTATTEAVQEIIGALVEGDPATGLSVLNQALDAGTDPRQLGRQIVDYLRSLLLLQSGNEGLVEVDPDARAGMAKHADSISTPALLSAIDEFSQAALQSRSSWQPGLALELAFLQSLTNEAQSSPRGSMGDPAVQAPTSTSAEQSASHLDGTQISSSPSSPEPQGSQDQVAFSGLQAEWRDLLQEVRKIDPRTQALLNSCHPLGVEKGSLVLGFRSDLLREKMEKGHNLESVRSAIAKVFGSEIDVRCVLLSHWEERGEPDQSSPPMEDNGMVATALRDLGGQVVDFENLPPEPGS